MLWSLVKMFYTISFECTFLLLTEDTVIFTTPPATETQLQCYTCMTTATAAATTTKCTIINTSSSSSSSNWAASGNHFLLLAFQSLLDCDRLAQDVMITHHWQVITTSTVVKHRINCTGNASQKWTPVNGHHSLAIGSDTSFWYQKWKKTVVEFCHVSLWPEDS